MRRSDPVWGIVLAGGRSHRMGRPKALLLADGTTLLEQAVTRLRAGGCADVVIVVNGTAASVLAEADRLGRVVPVRDAADAAPIDSLRAALQAFSPEVGGAVVLPVDCPLVQPATIARLLDALADQDVDAAVPTHDGSAGHPVALGPRLFDAAADPDLDEGLRTLLLRHAARVARIEVEDAGILVDLDTPDDARRHGVKVTWND